MVKQRTDEAQRMRKALFQLSGAVARHLRTTGKLLAHEQRDRYEVGESFRRLNYALEIALVQLDRGAR